MAVKALFHSNSGAAMGWYPHPCFDSLGGVWLKGAVKLVEQFVGEQARFSSQCSRVII